MAKSESQLFTTVAVRGPGRAHARVECPVTTAECASAQKFSVDALPELRYTKHWPWPGHPLPVYDREVGFFVGPILKPHLQCMQLQSIQAGQAAMVIQPV